MSPKVKISKFAFSAQDQVFSHCSSILAHLGCCNKLPQTEWFINRNLFLSDLKARSPKSGCQDGLLLLKTCSWVADCWFLMHSNSGKQASNLALLFLLIRPLSPFMRAPSLWPNYLTKILPPNTIILEVSHFNIGILVGHRQTYSPLYPGILGKTLWIT